MLRKCCHSNKRQACCNVCETRRDQPRRAGAPAAVCPLEMAAMRGLGEPRTFVRRTLAAAVESPSSFFAQATIRRPEVFGQEVAGMRMGGMEGFAKAEMLLGACRRAGKPGLTLRVVLSDATMGPVFACATQPGQVLRPIAAVTGGWRRVLSTMTADGALMHHGSRCGVEQSFARGGGGGGGDGAYRRPPLLAQRTDCLSNSVSRGIGIGIPGRG